MEAYGETIGAPLTTHDSLMDRVTKVNPAEGSAARPFDQENAPFVHHAKEILLGITGADE